MPPQASSRALLLCFGIGLGASFLLVARSQVGGDQLNLLARGWLLAEEGRWIPYGNPTSAGGKAPGGLTSLLIAPPLWLWRDHRAPVLVVLLFHVAAYALVDRTLRRTLGARGRFLLAVFYWLNPWRAYFSGFLWNPNYLFLFGAVHLWSAFTQRQRPRRWPSFAHAGVIVLAFQIHASFLLLAVASALLVWRGLLRLRWAWAAGGAALAAVPLVPWLREVAAEPSLVTGASEGFLGRGLLLIYPLLRGLLYWLRYASLALSEKALRFDFSDVLAPGLGARLGLAATRILNVLLPLTVVLPLLANRWLWRRSRRRPLRRGAPRSARAWLRGYAVLCFTAAAWVFALSPTTIMAWQGLILLHAAVLPVVLWLGVLGRTHLARRVHRLVGAWAAVEVFLLLLVAFGATHYRCAGHDRRDSFGLALRYDHPMLEELGIQATCPLPVNDPTGWWPDVLPPQ